MLITGASCTPWPVCDSSRYTSVKADAIVPNQAGGSHYHLFCYSLFGVRVLADNKSDLSRAALTDTKHGNDLRHDESCTNVRDAWRKSPRILLPRGGLSTLTSQQRRW